MKSELHTRIKCLALCTALSAALAACGGGSDSADTTGPTANSTTGVAAIGAPIVGGNVTLKCASGATASATTGTDGSWVVALKSSDYPCAVRVSGGKANGNTLASPLQSVAQGAGTTNITPLTDLLAGIVGGQNPATWYDNAKGSDLSSKITASTLSSAQSSLKTTLATLPGKPTLPAGFDPLSSKFSAAKGDAADDLLETYGSALAAAGLTQGDAATKAAAGTPLTQAVYAATAYTTPGFTAINAGMSGNLDGSYALLVPDPDRGVLTAKGSVDTNGNVTSLASGGVFTGIVSQLGNRIGQLCTAGTGGFSDKQHSQYVYASPDLTPVTDITELQGKTFSEYEDCSLTGTSTFTSDGAFVFTETGMASDEPEMNIQQAFTAQGLEEQGDSGTAVVHAKAWKYVANGKTTYVYLIVAGKKGSTTPAINGDTDYVTFGMAQ